MQLNSHNKTSLKYNLGVEVIVLRVYLRDTEPIEIYDWPGSPFLRELFARTNA
jgi:hypothetical protein